jgi:hypothetical protein
MARNAIDHFAVARLSGGNISYRRATRPASRFGQLQSVTRFARSCAAQHKVSLRRPHLIILRVPSSLP